MMSDDDDPDVREIRRDLHRPIPSRIRMLAVDKRGYPIPWFVPILANGEPEFRAMDRLRWARAVRERRCWICGEPLGRFVTFAIGPMCAISRTTAEPGGHLDCATWSAMSCPFLSRPHARRREDETTNNETLVAYSPGVANTRNPGVTCLWTTLTFSVFAPHIGNKGQLIEMGEPTAVAWYASGRSATRAEVLASIDSGFPALDALCDRDADPATARRELAAARAIVNNLLPRAMVTG